MKIFDFTNFLAILGFAGMLGVGPAMAQSATGTMTPVQDGTASTAPAAALAPAKSALPLSKSLEFATTAAAAAHCPSDSVVWSTLSRSHSFHTSDSRYFGKTKHGSYVCKADALAAGFHQAKS